MLFTSARVRSGRAGPVTPGWRRPAAVAPSAATAAHRAPGPAPQETLDVLLTLRDARCGRRPPAQAGRVARALGGASQMKISSDLEISQPSVSKALGAARWSDVEEVLGWWMCWTSGLSVI